ncbi:Hypothetical predicted protein [Drosophila guanche]|uniref:LITAF domain-containing protein n=1 Tax=Drosophila guanche TaxID=7266 RepID=A0A3B0IYF7_DROGU|nr:Hypothetical predicted protein [Drosophila guanche]
MSSPVGPEPSSLICPSCQQNVTTRTEPKASTKTHLIALIMCLTCLWCFACLPYCATSCMNANHFCGNCNKFVGVYNSD